MSDFAYYVFGQEPAVAVHLALWYVLLVCHQYDVCENSVGSVYLGGYGGLSESGLCVLLGKKLLMTSAISCPLWSSVYECQRVECAFTSPVRTECGMFVMYCMQCCMSVSAVL